MCLLHKPSAVPAPLAGQDMGLQLTKCPSDQEAQHVHVTLPYQYHSPHAELGSSQDITLQVGKLVPRQLIPRHFSLRESWLPEKNIQRPAWIYCTPTICQGIYTTLWCMLPNSLIGE